MLKKYIGEWVEIKGDVSSTYRKATEEEIKDSKILFEQIQSRRDIVEKEKKELVDLEKSCKHVIFYDEGGWIYDTRYCSACNKIMGVL